MHFFDVYGRISQNMEGENMLDYIWTGMLLVSAVTAAINGTMNELGMSLIDSAGEAIQLGISILGIVSLWTGLTKIGEEAGLLKKIGRKMLPVLHWLFPGIPKEHEAMEYIAANIVSNLIGLGWAATPPGLKAMKSMQKLNPHPDEATKDMCSFMIINMSSLQLIPINMLAYRVNFGSANPTEIVGPTIAATMASTLVAIIYVKIRYKFARKY